MRLDPQRKQALERQLQALADSGASLGELEAKLRGQDASGDDYDELWALAWALVWRARALSSDKDPGRGQKAE
jgi:hypothetical protein